MAISFEYKSHGFLLWSIFRLSQRFEPCAAPRSFGARFATPYSPALPQGTLAPERSAGECALGESEQIEVSGASGWGEFLSITSAREESDCAFHERATCSSLR